MLSKEENELLTRVGTGTAAGAMLRRYWWPVAFSEAVKAKGTPVKVKLLAEEFALFRDGAGQLGLVALHCSHRGTSLEYGRVEDNGIRCCYHGWLYDIQGNCLEQPAEPGDSTFKERIKHPAYHAHDAAVPLVYVSSTVQVAALKPFGRGKDDVFTICADRTGPVGDVGVRADGRGTGKRARRRGDERISAFAHIPCFAFGF